MITKQKVFQYLYVFMLEIRTLVILEQDLQLISTESIHRNNL